MICGGQADAFPEHQTGGGLHLRKGSPVVRGCRFENNYAFEQGGGCYVEAASPSLRNCTFEGKRTAGTLPDAVDGRYLLGIVCNISRKDEGLAIAEALLEARIEARDHMLAHLRTERDALLARTGEGWAAALGALLDKAMDAPGTLERLYWLRQAADDIRGRPASRHAALLRFAARRIHASFRVHHEERQAAYRYLAREVLPLK